MIRQRRSPDGSPRQHRDVCRCRPAKVTYILRYVDHHYCMLLIDSRHDRIDLRITIAFPPAPPKNKYNNTITNNETRKTPDGEKSKHKRVRILAI